MTEIDKDDQPAEPSLRTLVVAARAPVSSTPPPPITPRLVLAEERALLTLESSHSRARHAIAVAARAYPYGPPDRGAALTALEHRAMLSRTGVLHRLAPTASAKLHARIERVRMLIERASAPEGADGELTALLAVAGALPLEGHRDHVKARLRLRDIALSEPPPKAVRALADDLGVDTMAELADRLLAPKQFPLPTLPAGRRWTATCP